MLPNRCFWRAVNYCIMKEKKIKLPKIDKYKLIKDYETFLRKCRFGGSERGTMAKFIANVFKGGRCYFYNSKLKIKFFAGRHK